MLDLVLPAVCGGCGAPSTRWCAGCAGQLRLGPAGPRLVSPRVDPQVPVFALGRYAGARRQAIIAVKEHDRADLLAPLSRALGDGLHRLLAWGLIGTPLLAVPAPTRWAAARRRGGDPVARIAAAAVTGVAGVAVATPLRTKALTRDSVGLGGAARQRNIAGRVTLRRRRLPDRDAARCEILLVDDIVTTGATLAESVRVLRAAGARVGAALVIAAA